MANIKTYFITGNEHKFKEMKELIPTIEKYELHLPEIQEMNPRKVIEAKLLEAKGNIQGNYFVEDVSLCIHALNGFPGPLIKWMVGAIGTQGISDLMQLYEDTSATATVTIGYTDGHKIMFFEGTVTGHIVAPRVESAFGWDPIFVPNGQTKTYAEMTQTEKNKCSARSIAAHKLAIYLNAQK